MTKLLINFTRKIVYLLWLQNSGYIYSGIIIPVDVTEKYSKSSLKIRRWQRISTRGSPHHVTFPLSQWGGGVVGAAPRESKCRGL